MEFKQGKLVEREIEIAAYLLQGLSLKMISEKTGLSPRHIGAHISNMRIKFKAEDLQELVKLLKMTEL